MKLGSIDSEEAKMIVRDAIRKGWATMPAKMEETIHGKVITREQALVDLGDPSTWNAESEATMAKFAEKPAAPEPPPESVERHFCRWCGSVVAPVAGKCKHCGRDR